VIDFQNRLQRSHNQFATRIFSYSLYWNSDEHENHERRVETSACFHAKSLKDHIYSIILEKKVWMFFKYKDKNDRFTICDEPASYNAHTCSFYVS